MCEDGGKKVLSATLAQQIVDNCLKAYKERLQAKEKLLVYRLDKETKALKKKQALLNKNTDMDKEEEEEHLKFIQETTFKRRILEKRLEKVVVANVGTF